MGDGRCLSETIAFNQPAAGDFAELELYLYRKRGRSANAGPYGVQVVLLHVRVIDDRDIHGRYAGIDGALLVLEHLHDAFCVARVGHDHHAGTHLDRHAHRDGEPIHVVEGDGAHHDFHAVVEAATPLPKLHDVVDQVTMRKHGGLGHTRGAARVLEHCRIAGANLDLGRFRSG